ncbi:unnamed protein product [Moneuplotes crassus]|uniref:RBR-type E3 ubiquitin transferase n=1 Tax=Euplotes crassus TaxID=5936 RepID=A0AAD1ULB8_EUPCR|nr:unnamed protein product [Moneuplotes crassus]
MEVSHQESALDSTEEMVIDLMDKLAHVKKQFGFMEYFYAGVVFMKDFVRLKRRIGEEEGGDGVQKMVTELMNAREWSKKMHLTFQQKSLYFYNEFLGETGSGQSELTEEIHQDFDIREGVHYQSDNLHLRKRSHSQLENGINEQYYESHKRPRLSELDRVKQESIRKEEEQKLAAEEAKELVIGECKICLDDINMDTVQGIDTCVHLFHKECLQTYLETSIDNNKIPLVCPIGECKEEIPFPIVKEVLSEEYVERFDKFAFKLAINKNSQRFISCPTPDCEYVVCVEENDLQINPYFKCLSCQKEYCLECESQWHNGMSCQDYQTTYGKGKLDFNDKAAIDHAMDNNMRKCPDCKMWCVKESGCDAMVCYCGAGFCYRCGTKYNDAHVCQCQGVQYNRL